MSFLYWSTILGVNWKESEEKNRPDANDNDYDSMQFSVLTGFKNTTQGIAKIQFIWKPSTSASHCITTFHSTAPQCYISGFAAISLYHSLTSKSLAVCWDNADKRTQETLRTSLERDKKAVDKYKSKGFTYVAYSNYLEHKSSGSTAIGSSKEVSQRVVGDPECCIVPFDRFINTSTWTTSCTTYLKGLSDIRWFEGGSHLKPRIRADLGHIEFLCTVSSSTIINVEQKYNMSSMFRIGAIARSCNTVSYMNGDDRTECSENFYLLHTRLNNECNNAFGTSPSLNDMFRLRQYCFGRRLFALLTSISYSRIEAYLPC